LSYRLPGQCQEALAEAEANLEAVAAEKKRLLAQWRASLAALRQRDEALQVGRAFAVAPQT
jgi:hypothetical protein